MDLVLGVIENLKSLELRGNGVVLFQLLDEMMDNGFPLTTEPSVLKELILQTNLVSQVLRVVTRSLATLSSTLPSLATSLSVPWQASGIKHSKNETYFDLVEEMDATYDK